MKHSSLFRSFFVVTFSFANAAFSANIAWQAPQAVSSSLDVNTQGSLVTSKSTGYGYTVNGVFFDPAAANFSETFNTGAFGFMNGQTYIGTNNADGQAYAGLMNIAHLFNPDGPTQATITFSNLTEGQQYLVQYWVADYRGYPNDRYLTLTGGANTSGQIKYLDSDNSNGGIHGSYVIGTFTADATSQAIVINSNESTQMQAVQLRTNFAFTDADGIWTQADGNWSDTTKWDANAIAHGIDKSATFNGITPVTVTVDAGHPIGALNFSGANHMIAAGAGSLALDIDTVFTTPTVTVANGITATIGAQLNGSEGLTKAGTGTLVLSGSRIYTGTTDVTEGTLQYQGGTYATSLHSIATGAALDFNVPTGTHDGASTTFSGSGTLRKTGAGTIKWGVTVATIALDPGALIDVQEGTFTAGSDANESWSGNLSDLNVSSGATFNTVESNVRVNKITGSGIISTGYSGAGYQNLTLGVDNGSSTFDGVITDANAPGNLIKTGTGTITLTGRNTYTGNTGVHDGVLAISDTGSLRFLPTTNGSTNKVSGSATGTFSLLGTIDLDLSTATASGGNVWNLIDLSSFSGTPAVLTPAAVNSNLGDFIEVSSGVWELAVTGAKWSFTETDGNLAYTVTTTPYEVWGSGYGLAAGSETADADADGLTNFEEYAFGLLPNSGASSNPIAVGFVKNSGTFSYTRRTQSLTGLTYTVWVSTDLSNWTQDSTADQGTATAEGEVETVPVTVSSSWLTQPRLFIRVQAQ